MNLAFTKAGLLFVLLGSSGVGFAQPSQSSGPSPQDPAQVIQFLSQTIEWHRQLAVDQVVQLAFEYARDQAQLQTKQTARKPQASQPASSPGQYQRLMQLAQQTDQ